MRRAIVIISTAISAVLVPAPVLAAVTRSSITAPADQTTIDAGATTTVTIDGTTDGTTGDHVRVDCWSMSESGWELQNVTTNVALRPDGSFHYQGFLGLVVGGCVLAASDQTTGPTAPGGANTGPRLLVPYSFPSVIISGPNQGLLEAIAFAAPTPLAEVGVADVGDCGITSIQLAAGFYRYGSPLFTCGAGLAGADPLGTSSEVRVDGVDAYGAGSLSSAQATRLLDAFPRLAMTRALDPFALSTFHETDGFATCSPGGATPPTNQTCTTMTEAGIRLVRTITQSNGGLRLTVTDRWESTGAAHALDLLYEEALASTAPSFRPGWTATKMSTRQAGDLNAGPAGPGTLFIDPSPADPADIFNPQGAITWTQPPSQITWTSPSRITESYHRTIPAGGFVTITRTFDMAASRLALLGAARASLDVLTAPTLTATVRTRTRSTYVVVTGRATDLVGVARVTVAGRAVALDAGGNFRLLLAVKRGPRAITVVARDAAGNATTRTLHTRRY